jgi:hypothetical protein
LIASVTTLPMQHSASSALTMIRIVRTGLRRADVAGGGGAGGG